MAIAFPNPSRSFDAARQRIRFSGYDGAMEILFFIEGAALMEMDKSDRADEAALLRSFDHNRERICEIAARLYGRRRQDAYTLAGADFE